MATFTTPTFANWQSVSFVNELVNAYSERRQAIGQSAVDAVVAGDNIQLASFWRGMQEWVDINATSFYNHTNEIDGNTNIGELFGLLNYTLAEFRSVAGLNASGFRRSTDGSTFSYGNMQTGDIIGPWIFEDLQKAFDALRWVQVLPDFSVTGNSTQRTATGTGDSVAASISDMNWDGSSYVEITENDNNFYDAFFRLETLQESPLLIRATTRRRHAYLEFPTENFVPHTATFYIVPYRLGSGNYNNVDGFPEDTATVIEQFTSATTSKRTITTAPLTNSPIPASYSSPNSYEASSELNEILVVKYEFTNTLPV